LLQAHDKRRRGPVCDASRQEWHVVLLTGIIISASFARGGEKPNFTDSDAVFQDIRNKIDACSEAKNRNCMVSCGYAMRTPKNFIKTNPNGDPTIFQQRWQPCFEAHRDANLPETPVATAPSAPPGVRQSQTASSGPQQVRGRRTSTGR